MMCARCVSAVRTEMKSCFAISWFVWPRASSRSTSCSRSESGFSSARRSSSASAATRRAPELRVHVAAAAGDLADRGDDLGVGRLLEHVAARADGERLADVARVVLHREHEHLDALVLVQQRRHDVEAAPVGHRHVHQHQVGIDRARLEDRLARGAGLADDLDVLLALEQQPQPGADDRVVVDDQHANAHASGTSTFSVVPAFLRDST